MAKRVKEESGFIYFLVRVLSIKKGWRARQLCLKKGEGMEEGEREMVPSPFLSLFSFLLPL